MSNEGRRGRKGTTYATHESGAVVPVDRALAGIAGTADVTLAAKEDGVHERLRLVEVREEEDGRCDEREENGQVVGDDIIREGNRHGGGRAGGPGVLFDCCCCCRIGRELQEGGRNKSGKYSSTVS